MQREQKDDYTDVYLLIDQTDMNHIMSLKTLEFQGLVYEKH